MIYNYWVKGSTIDLENQRNFVFDKEWKKNKSVNVLYWELIKPCICLDHFQLISIIKISKIEKNEKLPKIPHS